MATADEISDCFYLIDRENKKRLPIDKLTKCIMTLGQSIPEDKMSDIKLIADPQSQGFFNLKDLERVMGHVMKERSLGSDIDTAYRIFDKMGKGYFTHDDMRDVLTRFANVDDAMVEDIIKACDQKGRGTITLEDFKGLFV
jgi:Ca2+-binding EF-hand superfamily protein